MKFANKLTAKAMLAVALLGVGGATISAIQHKIGGRLYYRSVLKGYANNVGWVYDSVGPWISTGM